MNDYRELLTTMAENLVMAGMNIDDPEAFGNAMESAEEIWDVILECFGL